MKKITRTALLPYSSLEVFNIVNDVDKYSEFLPWCANAKVLESNGNSLIARVDIAKAGIKQSFTTKNILVGGKSIQLNLVDGPFSHLEGIWEFTELDQNACKISLNLEYKVNNAIFNFALSALFEQIASTLVDSFCTRAKEVL
jgi:ribosome-associated toxin RatA of RatAB toxin-antitoxin module